MRDVRILTLRRDRRRAGVVAADDEHFAARRVGDGAGLRQCFDERHAARQRIGAGVLHLADHEDALASVLLDGHRQLRILEVAARQPRAQLGLDVAQRQSGGLHVSDQRKRERAVEFDRILAGQVRLVEHRDRQHVLRADHIVLDLGSCRRGEHAGAHHRKRVCGDA